MKKLLLIIPIFLMITLASCGSRSGNRVAKRNYAAVTLSDSSHAIVRLEPAVRTDLMNVGDKIHVRKINTGLEITLYPNFSFLAMNAYPDSTGTLRGTSVVHLDAGGSKVIAGVLVVPAVIDSLFRM